MLSHSWPRLVIFDHHFVQTILQDPDVAHFWRGLIGVHPWNIDMTCFFDFLLRRKNIVSNCFELFQVLFCLIFLPKGLGAHGQLIFLDAQLVQEATPQRCVSQLYENKDSNHTHMAGLLLFSFFIMSNLLVSAELTKWDD